MSFLHSSNSEVKSTILITGGASGIGLALSQRLLALGHVVIASGRRQAQLEKAQEGNPNLKIIQGDVSSDAGRIALFEQVTREYPDVNVLINNAGIINHAKLIDATAEDWQGHKDVLETNLTAPIHLSILFTPHFITKKHSLIANNTSCLAFFPVAGAPTYSATK
eukprot:gene46132-57521_t